MSSLSLFPVHNKESIGSYAPADKGNPLLLDAITKASGDKLADQRPYVLGARKLSCKKKKTEYGRCSRCWFGCSLLMLRVLCI